MESFGISKGGIVSEVLFENDDLKIVESLNTYVMYSKKRIRCVYDGECNIRRVCVDKE